MIQEVVHTHEHHENELPCGSSIARRVGRELQIGHGHACKTVVSRHVGGQWQKERALKHAGDGF